MVSEEFRLDIHVDVYAIVANKDDDVYVYVYVHVGMISMVVERM